MLAMIVVGVAWLFIRGQAPPLRGAGGETALADLLWKQGGGPTMTQPSTLPPAPPAPSTPAPWRERTLARLVSHVRAVLPVSAVAFVTAEAG